MSKFRFNPFRKSYTDEELHKMEYLSHVDIFNGLDYDEISLFLPYLHERSFQKDEVIFFRGDPSLALYIIKSGIVSLAIDYQEDLEELTKVGAGSSLGESCLLPGTKRLLNATVFSDISEMWVIPQLNVLEIFENNIPIRAKIFESLSKLYHNYNSSLFEAYRKSLGFFHLPMVYKNPG